MPDRIYYGYPLIMALNARQQLFVAHYLKTTNATESAKAAGYSEKTAKSIGSELLSKPDIKAAIEGKVKSIIERLDIGPDYILGSLRKIAERCMQAVPVEAWDHEAKQMVKTGEWKFESAGANKALELLGKSKFNKLFTDNLEIDDKSGIAEKLNRFKRKTKPQEE